MTRLLVLHLEIDRRVQQYIQDANLNSGTPIFKIRILAQFVSHDFLK